MTNLTFTDEELRTLKRVLRKELHDDLNREPSCKGKGYLEERAEMLIYKLSLLHKLGNKETMSEVKHYEC